MFTRHLVARFFYLVLCCAPLSGCYVAQAVTGHLEVMNRRQAIDAVLANPETPRQLRDRLEYVRAARQFAVQKLSLPDNRSYTTYADVGRPYVVWNVFAAPRFSLEPLRWCFPVAGCVVYRGYFREADALSYALGLRARGYDAAVFGVAAYSTLGHFADPVLNTMLGWNDAQLAGTLFHELAHQLVYIASDSEFNEAFATVVEEAGVRAWLTERGRTQELERWELARRRNVEFAQLLLRIRDELRRLYASGLSREQMAEKKTATFGRLKFDYYLLRQRWGGYSGYDQWFDRALGNAHLIPIATYHDCVPGLRAVLNEVNGDLSNFYLRARKLSELPAVARRATVCGKITAPIARVSE